MRRQKQDYVSCPVGKVGSYGWGGGGGGRGEVSSLGGWHWLVIFSVRIMEHVLARFKGG